MGVQDRDWYREHYNRRQADKRRSPLPFWLSACIWLFAVFAVLWIVRWVQALPLPLSEVLRAWWAFGPDHWFSVRP